jgi:YNFM family putative membrane transporter
VTAATDPLDVSVLDRDAASRLHRPGSPGYRRFNLAMMLAGLGAFGILYAAQPVLPQISDEFGVSPTRAALAVSASTGALALCVLPAAALAIRWGRVRTMRTGLLLAVLFTLLAAAAPTFGSLIVLRALAGAVLAGVVAVAMGHVGSETHPSGLGSAMGLYVAGNSLGGVGGRLITAAVADATSWHWGVGLLAAAALVVTVAFWRLLPEPVALDEEDPRQDATAGRLRSTPGVWALVAIPFLLMGGFVAVYNYLGYRLLAAPFSLPLAVAGLVFLAYLAGSVSSAVAGRLADALGRPRVLVAAVLLMGAGIALTVPDRLVLVVVGLVVFTTGFFAAHAVASGWMPVVAAPHRTRGSALYVCGYYAGSSVFGALLGLTWTDAGWTGVAAGVGVLVALALVATAAVVRATARRTAR